MIWLWTVFLVAQLWSIRAQQIEAGKAVRLSGSDFVRTALDEPFYDFTFEFWFNAAGPGVLLNEVHRDDAALWDYTLAEIAPDGMIRAVVPGLEAIDVGTISFGSWRHLALVFDSSSGTLSAYLDGAPAGVSHGTRVILADRWNINHCLGRGGPKNLGKGTFFTGLFDEVRLWRKPLSADAIAFQYNKVLRVQDMDLRFGWHFDEVVPGKTYLSPGTLERHEAMHVPQTALPLVSSTAPLVKDPRPFVETASALPVASGTVDLKGSVNPNGSETIVYFEYTSFQQTHSRNIGSGAETVSFTEVVPNLVVAGGYDYRLVASNTFGVTRSYWKFFSPVSWAGHAYQCTAVFFHPGTFLRTTNSQNGFFSDKNITVELWFAPDYPGVLFSETDFAGYDTRVIETTFDGKVVAGFNGIPRITLGNFQSNAWNHVALRYDASTLKMDGFLNGVRTVSTNGVRVTPREIGVEGQFAFGYSNETVLGSALNFLGMLEEMRVWNVPRTDEDLTTARFNLLAGDEPGLVLNWRGDAAGNDTVSDFSPRHNNGQNVGCGVWASTAPLTFNIRQQGENAIETQFAMKAGTVYRLETSTDLVFWTAVSTNTAPESGHVRLPQDKSSPTPKFFRVVAQ